MKQTLVATLALSLATTAGCDTVLSDDIPTEDMRLYTRAEVSESGRVSVLTQLTTDNPALLERTFVDLGPDDALLAELEGEIAPMRREWVPVLNMVQYRAEFALGQEGDELSITLDRGFESSASDSSVRLPGAFDLDAPVQFSREEPLTIEWTAAPSQASSVAMRGSCLEDVSYSFDANPGLLTVPAPRLEKKEDSASEVCDVTLTVRLSNAGDADPAFDRGSSMAAEQVRTQELESRP